MGLMVALAGLAMPAQAETGARDLQLIARTMGFLARPPSGTVEIGIVHPAGSDPGRTEAERIAAIFGSGLVVGALTLHPRVMTIEDAARAPVPVLLLTNAALPQATSLATALAGKGVLTVSTDPASVDARQVVVAVRSQPRVEIFVSRAAALAAGLEFSSAFRMLIQER
ncbi:YfiR/HmsC family protein [Rhodovastum atsumiense]|nr:YfiR/HmsC family protein [Rhodovastum atsumiense]